MDIEKIEKFIDAGYTKQEIDEMLKDKGAGAGEQKPQENESAGAGKQKPQENESAGAGEQKPQEQSKASQTHESALTSDDMLKSIEALTKTVDGLTNTVKAMQEANVNNANGGRAGTDTVGDVINSFIKEL